MKTVDDYVNFLEKIKDTVSQKESSHYNPILADYINYFLEGDQKE